MPCPSKSRYRERSEMEPDRMDFANEENPRRLPNQRQAAPSASNIYNAGNIFQQTITAPTSNDNATILHMMQLIQTQLAQQQEVLMQLMQRPSQTPTTKSPTEMSLDFTARTLS